MDQGSDFGATIELTNDDNTPINVTGAEFKSQIRKSYYSGYVAAEFTVIELDSANGVIRLSLTADQTSNVSAGRYVYDL
jgi:hypothetical protein